MDTKLAGILIQTENKAWLRFQVRTTLPTLNKYTKYYELQIVSIIEHDFDLYSCVIDFKYICRK